MSAPAAQPRRTPPDIEGKLPEEQMRLFREIANERHVKPNALLREIVEQWIEQHRSPANGSIALPADSAVLLENESLKQYLVRARLNVFAAVHLKEGNNCRMARRLKLERTGMLKLIRRLKAKTNNDNPTPVDSETDILSEGPNARDCHHQATQ